jgi:hypothetical protein
MERKLKKYKQNLCIVSYNYIDYVKSYSTLVARIDWSNNRLVQLGWWSDTTQKHINYVAKEYGMEVVQENSI